MFEELFLGIKKIEKTINEKIKEEINESWGDLQVVKIDFEDLVADFILDLLDVAAIPIFFYQFFLFFLISSLFFIPFHLNTIRIDF